MVPKPDWLRVRAAETPEREAVEHILRGLKLNTVCREANCPNVKDCFSRKTATFMILGTRCTRDCRFCNVTHDQPLPPDPAEPENVARAVREMGLRYAVVTSVTRDDLPGGGAAHFAQTVSEIRRYAPDTAVEVLIPDFQGDLDALKTVTDASPAVISHNMETVRPLYPQVRPQAEYGRSLALLREIKRLNPAVRSKTGFMLGLGETEEQVLELLRDLRAAGCEFLTIGQYLAPSKRHHPVVEYVEPARFEAYGRLALDMGFAYAASAPLVRSSYRAGEALAMR